ncbi:transcriptional repressor LexA [Candidatus Actinomarina sp.]|jgi:repressor LexA|nr:transcriptional repressor LexA [Acidimicrobiia bacterium]MDA8667743.1 transcriptional repressor LexA [Candidatus Actinomarina sp.]MDA8812976.1 transcriptional repressor LexA [Candidatus Actinomarina sp.]MDA9198076.1 transcriptional repressor LexA [Acidimicrobiia bacterium]MDA9844338.1 transcriptional repressor LexA [Acidimicrobiia bacterium]|tara:strand:- start:353 stop:940 length:588 start_codon:yes stop_codon:yes gene_type:complete
MSNKAQEILEFINFTLKNDGYSPSVREICEAVNLKSTSTVQYHLNKLEKKGVINKSDGKSRSLHLNNSISEFRSVPIVGEIAAGLPLSAEENQIGELPYPESNFNDSLIALKVNGDSMIDAGIHDGDLVVVDKSKKPLDGDIGAFLVYDTEATVKYIDTIRNKQYLIPANKNYENIEISENISTVGKVVSLFRDM